MFITAVEDGWNIAYTFDANSTKDSQKILDHISKYLDEDVETQCRELAPFIEYCFFRQAYRLSPKNSKSEALLQKIVDKGFGKRERFDFVFPNEKKGSIIKTMNKYGIEAEYQLDNLLEYKEELNEFKDIDIGKWEYKDLSDGFNGLKTKGLIISVYCHWC